MWWRGGVRGNIARDILLGGGGGRGRRGGKRGKRGGWRKEGRLEERGEVGRVKF